MEAANRGPADAGGASIGLNIGLPHEQRPNPCITPELSLEFRYFFMRKLWFAHLARSIWRARSRAATARHGDAGYAT
jgi:predicted Rossmann-fold nucleotide-binding protein